ncbi:MAG: hypothetical protein B5M55_06145 [Desulfococcus sp. 4484_242]|nr:MAG: hypothetical protein B5M55_06145 [Desulfococcus sp. 4484_242]
MFGKTVVFPLRPDHKTVRFRDKHADMVPARVRDATETTRQPLTALEEFMKVKVIEKVKFAPGKWREAGKILKTYKELTEKNGYPSFRTYTYISGGDGVQTLTFVSDWDSLARMETLMDRMPADPEMMQFMQRWAEIVESHEVSILKEVLTEEIGMA